MAKRKNPAAGRKRNSKGQFTKRTASKRRARRASTAKRKNPQSSAKRRAAARKAAQTRKRNQRRRTNPATRRRRTTAPARRRTTAPARRRTASRPTGAARSYRRNPMPRDSQGRFLTKNGGRRRKAPARRYRRNPPPKNQAHVRKQSRDAQGRFTDRHGYQTLVRARRYIKGKQGVSGAAKGYAQRFDMRSNPYGLSDALIGVIPIAVSFNAGRYLVNRLGPMIPGSKELGEFAGPVQSGAVFVLSHFAQRHVRALQPWGPAITAGLGLTMLDSLVQAFAPPTVKRALGVRKAPKGKKEVDSPEDQDEYLSVNEYLSVQGAKPIDTRLTLGRGGRRKRGGGRKSQGEYLSVGGVEAELGNVEQELGNVQADLGREPRAALGSADRGFEDRGLGGVHRGGMGGRRPKQAQMRKRVPERSFTRPVESFGEEQNAPDQLYTGIFGGGGSIGG